MKKIFCIVLFLIIFWGCPCAQKLYAVVGEARARYGEAVRHIKANQLDFAFMEFRSIVRDFPKSPLAQRSAFAIAEYYYENKMHADAAKEFTAHIKNYPDSKANIFAKAYLLKIMEEIQNPTPEEKKMLDDINMYFFSKPLFLLFTEYKEASYKSASLNKFSIRYYIDNIEVYRNGRLFIKITQ